MNEFEYPKAILLNSNLKDSAESQVDYWGLLNKFILSKWYLYLAFSIICIGFAYVYYKLILKMYCSYFLNDFEKKYCKKITNQYIYFLGLFFYGLILTLVFPIILSGGTLISSETKGLFNYFISLLNKFDAKVFSDFSYRSRRHFLT